MSGAAEGACLCGAVTFSGEGGPSAFWVCHCGQCRQWTSGPFHAVHFRGGITLGAGSPLTWFRSSDIGERGFCAACGSTLFYRRTGEARDWATSAGSLHDSSGLTVTANVWIEDMPEWAKHAHAAPGMTAEDFLEDRPVREVEP
ncbi:MAG: GFA family protein [Pseudomonadota bacterium]